MKSFTTLQNIVLIALRFLIGWHILYEGVAKLLNPAWTSAGFLKESQWILSGFARWVTSHAGILEVVDFLNTWGLIAIGLGIIMGFCFKTAAISGSILLLVYYLNSPPLVGIEYTVPADGNNLVVNKTLIEAVTLLALALFSTSKIFGVDVLFSNRKIKKEGV